MSKLNRGNTPLPLNVPLNSLFNAYLINTNGLRPTKTKPLSGGSDPVKINKIKFLQDLTIKWRLNAIHIMETHDDNPVALGPLAGWHATPSTPVGGKHGTAVVMALQPEKCMVDTNVDATLTTWEYQPIWLVTAYFPNDLESAKATIKALKGIMRKLKSKRVILSGDFNSTETRSLYDTEGALPPTNTKNTNAIQEILDTYGFKDLWAHGDNKAREQERPKLQHLTHWNHDHTRGVRIDRVYTNFAIRGNIKVTTWHHLGSDHRGVLYI
jgi:hypothetical protein